MDPYDQPRDKSKGKGKAEEKVEEPVVAAPAEVEEESSTEVDDQSDLPESLRFEPLPTWSSKTTRTLRPVFSDPTIASFHALLVEGKDPPPKSDGGWGSRKAKVEAAVGNEEEAMNIEEAGNAAPAHIDGGSVGGRGQGRDRGRGRGRGGRGGGRGGRGGGDSDQWWVYKDDREVLSQVSETPRTRCVLKSC